MPVVHPQNVPNQLIAFALPIPTLSIAMQPQELRQSTPESCSWYGNKKAQSPAYVDLRYRVHLAINFLGILNASFELFLVPQQLGLLCKDGRNTHHVNLNLLPIFSNPLPTL